MKYCRITLIYVTYILIGIYLSQKTIKLISLNIPTYYLLIQKNFNNFQQENVYVLKFMNHLVNILKVQFHLTKYKNTQVSHIFFSFSFFTNAKLPRKNQSFLKNSNDW